MKYKVDRVLESTDEFFIEAENTIELREQLRKDFEEGIIPRTLLINKLATYFIVRDNEQVVEEYKLHWNNIDEV